MTTDVNVPYEDYTADGVIDRFAFTYPIVENVDQIVLVDSQDGEGLILQVEFSAYIIENLTDDGADIVFQPNFIPIDEARVLILRRTTITQNVDYELFEGFPAETHEFNLDKITYILQELLGGAFGGKDSDGNPVYISFDLSTTAGVTTVTINNSGGTDAEIPPWVSGETAGVFHGELTLAAPEDEAVTTKADGYMWIEYE